MNCLGPALLGLDWDKNAWWEAEKVSCVVYVWKVLPVETVVCLEGPVGAVLLAEDGVPLAALDCVGEFSPESLFFISAIGY